MIKLIRKTGGSRIGTLYASYKTIVAALGRPNCTDLDDSDKVKASWGFSDELGREAFVWCYKVPSAERCETWSVDGNMDLLRELFGGALGA